MVTRIIMMAPGLGMCVHIKVYESEEKARHIHPNIGKSYARSVNDGRVDYKSPSFVKRVGYLAAAAFYNIPIVCLED